MSLRDEVARCYDALNRGDPNPFLALYDPEIELFIPAWVSLDHGIFRGADAVNRWYANNFAQWSGQHWELIELAENGPNVTFVLRWVGQGKRSGAQVSGRYFGVMSFQDGRIVSIVHLGALGEATPRVTTFHTKFLGCKVSQADAMLARMRLLEAGHTEAPEADADLHVVNTCCITREAEAKSRQSVRRSANGGAGRRVVVTGCAANLDAAQFDALGPQVTALVGTADDVAAEVAGGAGPGCADVETDVLARQPLSAVRTRGFVKVQDGCDCHCAYCIIPKVRGAARSRPSGAVLDEVRRRVEQGQPEMVMTGISVGDYRDPERGLELGHLMRAVAAVPGVERVRLSSVEVIHVRDSLLDALAEEPRICPHLHVPLQSGDDAVLAAMGRNYDSPGYKQAIARLRARVPAVNLTTDVIVGYPAEDGAAFERTLALVRETGITKVHTFSFSPRPGTEADRLGDPVSPQEKKRRSRELRGLSEALGRRHRAAQLGTIEGVLVDKVADEQVSGYTSDYTRWYLPAGAAHAGQIVTARATELYADGCAGVPI